jgi:hypothetical protein
MFPPNSPESGAVSVILSAFSGFVNPLPSKSSDFIRKHGQRKFMFFSKSP